MGIRVCNILVVKIPKIKVCDPSQFMKTCFVTSLTNQCHVLFEITFLLSHICSSLFRITDKSNRSKGIFLYKCTSGVTTV